MPTRRKQARSLSLVLAVLSSACLGAADSRGVDVDEQLGAVSFPTSCAESVQKPFERGVALLHSFEYEEADKQFQQVAQSDPTCAMAYWGQAMSLYHQLWSRPTKADLRDGWTLIRKARKIKARTPRERDYIDALAVFYRDSGATGHATRAAAYARAMKEVYRRYSQDREAAAFYALSLLGSSPGGRSSNEEKAIAILSDLFQVEPDHPGVAHYLIHGCDSPRFAPMGLAAARRYASIAPSSPHAVHMPSHIFARLGLWQDDINSNLAALQAASNQAAANVHVTQHQLHSLDFLEYAYLQTGQDAKARDVIDQVATLTQERSQEHLSNLSNYSLLHSRTLYVLETRQWKEALSLQAPAGVEPANQAMIHWAQAIAAGHLRDAAAARRAVKQHRTVLSSKSHVAHTESADGGEAQAWLHFAEGQTERALRLMRSVADQQDREGTGEADLPAREMLADMLLESNRPQEALVEYEKSLRIAPNRFNGLYGAARAAELSHQPDKASGFYARLLANCKGADSERPELARARTVAMH